MKKLLCLTLALAVLLSLTPVASAWHHRVPVARIPMVPPVYAPAGGGLSMSFSMQGDATAALMLLPLLQRVFGGVAAIDPQLRPFADILQALFPNPNTPSAAQARALTDQMAAMNKQMAALGEKLDTLTDTMKALPGQIKEINKTNQKLDGGSTTGRAAPATPALGDPAAREEIKRALAEIKARQDARASAIAARSVPAHPRGEIQQQLAEIQARRAARLQILASRGN